MRTSILYIILLFCIGNQYSIAQVKSVKFIALKSDTIYFENNDSLISRKGDDYSGVVNLGYDAGTSLFFIEGGFVVKRIDYNSISKIKQETNLKARKYFGIYKCWNENDTLLISGHYTDNYEDSVWIFYYSNGAKETEGRFTIDSTKMVHNFKITLLNGFPHSYNPITFEKSIPHSPPDGDWLFYNRQGELIKTLTFDKGTLVGLTVGAFN